MIERIADHSVPIRLGYARANGKLSLSRMTFSHQLVRVLFVEQFYRAMTIQRGEPYHHE